MARPWSVPPRNRGSIPGMVQDFSFLQECLWGLPSVLLNTVAAFTWVKEARAWCLISSSSGKCEFICTPAPRAFISHTETTVPVTGGYEIAWTMRNVQSSFNGGYEIAWTIRDIQPSFNGGCEIAWTIRDIQHLPYECSPTPRAIEETCPRQPSLGGFIRFVSCGRNIH